MQRLFPRFLRTVAATSPRFTPTTATTTSPSLFNRNFTTTPPATMSITQIAAYDQYTAALEASKSQLVVIDFFATWCGPCRAIAPTLQRMAASHTDVAFYKLDVDQNSNVAAELGIRAMPTFVLFRDGVRIVGADVVGANPTALEAAIQRHR